MDEIVQMLEVQNRGFPLVGPHIALSILSADLLLDSLLGYICHIQ